MSKLSEVSPAPPRLTRLASAEMQVMRATYRLNKLHQDFLILTALLKKQQSFFYWFVFTSHQFSVSLAVLLFDLRVCLCAVHFSFDPRCNPGDSRGLQVPAAPTCGCLSSRQRRRLPSQSRCTLEPRHRHRESSQNGRVGAGKMESEWQAKN